MKNICILGSTGSIGTQALELIRENPGLRAVALAALQNIELLEKQVREFRPELVCVYREDKALELKERLRDLDVKVVSGMDGLCEAAVLPSSDLVLGAVVGMIGIRPTMEAIRAGKDIALANKETLVCAGHLIIPLAKEHHVKLLPVDSEHSAIFQCLQGESMNPLRRILLTASGGPFRGYTREQLRNVGPEDALKHPNWTMGSKITIDSSTMVNKGLEVMEAKWLFGVDYEEIEVLVQPKSIIHSMVEFRDGAVKAQLGTPDMKLPIHYAFFYPERVPFGGGHLDFSQISGIALEKPDLEVFDGLALGYEVGRKGGNAPTVYNAANEFAVARFLRKEIGYLDIVENIRYALSNVAFREDPSLEEILETEKETREVLSCRL